LCQECAKSCKFPFKIKWFFVNFIRSDVSGHLLINE
jgi:hypothetical protein